MSMTAPTPTVTPTSTDFDFGNLQYDEYTGKIVGIEGLEEYLKKKNEPVAGKPVDTHSYEAIKAYTELKQNFLRYKTVLHIPGSEQYTFEYWNGTGEYITPKNTIPIMMAPKSDQYKVVFDARQEMNHQSWPWNSDKEYNIYVNLGLAANMRYQTEETRKYIEEVSTFWSQHIKDRNMQVYFEHMRNQGDLYVSVGGYSSGAEFPKLGQLIRYLQMDQLRTLRVCNADNKWLQEKCRITKELNAFPIKAAFVMKIGLEVTAEFPYIEFTPVNVGMMRRSVNEFEYRRYENQEYAQEIQQNRTSIRPITPEQLNVQRWKAGKRMAGVQMSFEEEAYNEEDDEIVAKIKAQLEGKIDVQS